MTIQCNTINNTSTINQNTTINSQTKPQPKSKEITTNKKQDTQQTNTQNRFQLLRKVEDENTNKNVGEKNNKTKKLEEPRTPEVIPKSKPRSRSNSISRSRSNTKGKDPLQNSQMTDKSMDSLEMEVEEGRNEASPPKKTQHQSLSKQKGKKNKTKWIHSPEQTPVPELLTAEMKSQAKQHHHRPIKQELGKDQDPDPNLPQEKETKKHRRKWK